MTSNIRFSKCSLSSAFFIQNINFFALFAKTLCCNFFQPIMKQPQNIATSVCTIPQPAFDYFKIAYFKKFKINFVALTLSIKLFQGFWAELKL